jgi:hypothetical protein
METKVVTRHSRNGSDRSPYAITYFGSQDRPSNASAIEPARNYEVSFWFAADQSDHRMTSSSHCLN